MSNTIIQTNTDPKSGNLELGKYHWRTLWASTVGYAMDGLDLMILSYVMPFIIAYFGLNSAQAGLIATVTLIGAVIGGYVFGILADIYGRIKTFSLSILIFSVFTGLSAFTTDIFWFDVTRFIAGLGLGGEFGIGMTLVCEVWPKKYRSRATGVVAAGFQVGMILALLSSMVFAPRFGWQSVFLIGALPALFAWWSRRGLQEPAVWVENKKKQAGGNTKFPIYHLFSSAKTTGATIGLIIITGVQNFGFYGIMTWLPTMLAQQLHFSFNKSLTWTFTTIFGMMIGILLFGVFADRWGRRKAFLTFQIGSAIIVWVFFQQSSPTILLILGAIMGFFVDGMLGGYGAEIAEHYPTEARSTAENFIFNTGRAIGGFGPFVIGYLALNHTLSWSLGLLSAIYILAALAVLFLIPKINSKEIA